MNNLYLQPSNDEFSIKITKIEGEEKSSNSKMQRGSSSQCRITSESPVKPIQELSDTLAQGNSYDKRECSEVSEAQKSTASESKHLTKSTQPQSHSPFTSQNLTTDTRCEKLSEYKSQEEEKRHQHGKYRGQAKPFGTESSERESSEMEYQCVDTSNCEVSDTGRLTDYDGSLIEGWLEDSENPSPLKSSQDMATIKEVSEENISETTYRVTGPKMLIRPYNRTNTLKVISIFTILDSLCLHLHGGGERKRKRWDFSRILQGIQPHGVCKKDK